MSKCRKKPAGEVTHEPIEVSCNESSLDSHSVYEASHDIQLIEEEQKQEVIGGKRLADHPSVVLEEAVEEGPRPPKVPRLQARKAVPPFEDNNLDTLTVSDIQRTIDENTEKWKSNVM